MPSLSLLKRFPRDPNPEPPRNCQSPENSAGDGRVASPPPLDSNDGGNGSPSVGPGRERRNSKRDFLYDLIGRSRLIGKSSSNSSPPSSSAASSTATPQRGRSGSSHLVSATAAVRFFFFSFSRFSVLPSLPSPSPPILSPRFFSVLAPAHLQFPLLQQSKPLGAHRERATPASTPSPLPSILSCSLQHATAPLSSMSTELLTKTGVPSSPDCRVTTFLRARLFLHSLNHI